MTATIKQTNNADYSTMSTFAQAVARDLSAGLVFVRDARSFERLHSHYIAARAKIANPDGPRGDAARNVLRKIFWLSELVLLATPAPSPADIWVKFEILEMVVNDEIKDGTHAGPRVLMALASVKHDLHMFENKYNDLMHAASAAKR